MGVPFRMCLALLALLLTGCLEVEERLAFEREGNGTYALTLRWNADLLARVRDTAGERALAAFEGRSFPLSVAACRDGLAPLPGVKIERLHEAVGEGGWKTLEVRLAFGTLEDLLRWEALAGRPLEVGPAGEPRLGRLSMRPIEHVPLLERLREALEARRGPAPTEFASEVVKDPPPWARLGLDEGRLVLLERMLAPALDRVRLSFEVAPAGRVLEASAPVVEQEAGRARFEWRWTDLLAGPPRSLTLGFQAGEFDKIPAARQPAASP